jgi:hypothetical protein
MADKVAAQPATTTTQPVKPSSLSQSSAAAASKSTATTANKPASPSSQNREEGRYTYLLRIQVGNLSFSNLRGDFLGEPVISLRTRQYSEVCVVLNDSSGETRTTDNPQAVTNQPPAAIPPALPNNAGQNQTGKPDEGKPAASTTQANTPQSKSTEQSLDGSLWSRINANIGSDVAIELGYPPDKVQTIFSGKLYRVGRKFPDGVILELVDNSATLGNSTISTVVATGEKPVDKDSFTSADPSTLKVAQGASLQTFNPANTIAAPTTGNLSISSASPDLFSAGSGTGGQNANTSPITPPKASTAQSSVDTSTTQGKALEQQKKAADAALGKSGQPTSGVLDTVTALTPDLKYIAATQGNKTGDAGVIAMSQSALSAAVREAALKGDVIIAEGNTIKQVGPGQGESTGLVLSWQEHRNAFIRPPTITKKTPYQLQSGYGAVTVQGWSPNDKAMVSATVVTTSPTSPHPTGNIQVPKWGQVNLKDAIVPGGKWTWGDATRNGQRVPESESVMKGIILAAQNLIAIEQKYGAGIEVTSWYRPPRENARVSSSGLSGPHTTGSAVDFYHPKMSRIHADYAKSWEGGVAISPNSFIHLDAIGVPGANGLPGSPRRRWSY